MTCEAASHMHGPEGMLETAVLSGGINPECALELVDVSQPLNPRIVEDRFLCSELIRAGKGSAVMDVSVHRI